VDLLCSLVLPGDPSGAQLNALPIVVLPLVLLGGIALHFCLRRRLRQARRRSWDGAIDADYTVVEHRQGRNLPAIGDGGPILNLDTSPPNLSVPGSGPLWQSSPSCDVGLSHLRSSVTRAPHLGDDCDVLLIRIPLW
jgi:hypothetical protein